MNETKATAVQVLDQLSGEAWELFDRAISQRDDAAVTGRWSVAASRDAQAKGIELVLDRIRSKIKALNALAETGDDE